MLLTISCLTVHVYSLHIVLSHVRSWAYFVTSTNSNHEISLDLWPEVEKYLSQTLLGEKLSERAETERNALLEQIEIAKLPPGLPPRQDGEYFVKP